MNLELIPEAVELIKDDPELYGSVAKALDVRPMYLSKLLRENNRRLTEYQVVQIVSEKMNRKPSEVLTGEQITN